MNRRTLLQRLATCAAAIVGAGLVAKPAEASEQVATSNGYGLRISPGVTGEEYGLRVNTSRAVERAVIYGNDRATLHLRAGTFTANEVNAWMAQSGATNIVGAGVGQTVITGPDPVMAPGGASFIWYQGVPPTELANHCMTCDWVGAWSTEIGERRASEMVSEFHNHVMYEHDGSLTAMGRGDTVWRQSLHDEGMR